jgi:DNA-binding transcriptional regulator YdaS (Cro superfamily)
MPAVTPMHPIEEAIAHVGLAPLARALSVSTQAIRKWQAGGRMPRTEWTGETAYCPAIEALTEGKVTRAMLLAPWPEWQPARGGAAVEETNDAA